MSKLLFKYYQQKVLFISITIIVIFFITGCSSREESPVILDDSTIVYPSKSENGISGKITFSNKISKKTGKPLKVASVFKIRDKAKVYTTIELINYKSANQKELMLHIDWLDSTGNSFYKKRIDFSPTDSSSSIKSSISTSPQKRKAGNYTVRVYLFRELIAEKKFQLIESFQDSATVKKKIKSEKNIENQKSIKTKVKTEIIEANILLCRKVSKKTSKPIGAGTVFTIKEKANVKAIVSFEKPAIKTDEQMKFYFNWIGLDGKSFYKKRVVYTTSSPSFFIFSSISITPEKRQPGIYTLQVIFSKKIIAEQKFELVAQTK